MPFPRFGKGLLASPLAQKLPKAPVRTGKRSCPGSDSSCYPRGDYRMLSVREGTLAHEHPLNQLEPFETPAGSKGDNFMRIALLSWETLHSISIGGVAVHVTELAAALERKGHEVHVFTRMRCPGDWHYDRIHGVHYHRVPYGGNADFIEDTNNMCRAFVGAVFQTE